MITSIKSSFRLCVDKHEITMLYITAFITRIPYKQMKCFILKLLNNDFAAQFRMFCYKAIWDV